MTPEEAIKQLEDIVAGDIELGRDEFVKAYHLGIEALKRVKDMRISPCTTADELLPGETETP